MPKVKTITLGGEETAVQNKVLYEAINDPSYWISQFEE